MIMRDYVRICKPAFFSTGIPDHNLLFDLLLGKEISTEQAEEYGERYWRLTGRHTLICIDTGGYAILERVEECHHDNSILDELFAAASLLTKAGLKRKQEFFERAGEEKVREFITEHSDYFAEVFESDEWADKEVAETIANSPAPVLSQLLHALLDKEKEKGRENEGHIIARVVSALGGERLLAVLGNDFRLRRKLLPLLV